MLTNLRDAEPIRARWPQSGAALVLALFWLVWTPASALADSIQIIVNPAQAGAPIDRTLLRSIFTMRLRQWPDGTPVRVFVLPDRDEATALFCREQLGTYPYVMRSTWDRLVFTGTGLAPTVVGSEREMRERVRLTPGAIGYVHGDAISDVRGSLPKLLSAAQSSHPRG
jgi:hypothetical protein